MNKTEKQVFQTLKREHQKGEKKSFKSLSSLVIINFTLLHNILDYSEGLFQSNQIYYKSYYVMIFGHQDIFED